MRQSFDVEIPGHDDAKFAPTRTRILQLIGSLHPGGAEKVVAQLATGLDPAFYDVRVACVRDRGRIGDEIAARGVPVIKLMTDRGGSPYLAPWQLQGQLREFRPHVVHSHGIIALTTAGPLVLPRCLPRWVHTFHFGNYPYPSRRQMLIEAALCRGAAQLACVAHAQREAIIRCHRLGPERLVVVPNGVSPNRFVDDETCRRTKRAEFGFNDRDFVVGTICVLSEQKGITHLLGAAKELLRRHAGLKFLIVGSGPLEAELRKQAQNDGIEDYVHFTGWRADVEEIFVALDVFVMPSLWEAMPLALLEAMAARRPIVVTDVGNNPQFVARGECAILIKPGDPGAIAAAIDALWSNRRLSGQLAARAHDRCHSHFGVARMLGGYERLYRPSIPSASLRNRLKFAARKVANVHVRGPDPDVFLFATPRGGSTWLMEIIASQPGMKFFDEPLNPRRADVACGGWIQDFESLMPDTGDDSRIIEYLRGLQQGRHGYMNPTPFRPAHRFLTNRAVFKIHEIEHLMGAVTRECGGMAVYLLRHPIATSLSRHSLPRLELFLGSRFYSRLIGEETRLSMIRRIAAGGSHLQRAVISWCFENAVALRSPPPDMLLLTYEELVLNPERSCDLLMQRLRLPDRHRMLAAFSRPASNISMSGPRTASAMSVIDAAEQRLRLVTKWQEAIGSSELDQVAEVMSIFGMSAYAPDAILADAHHLHFADTAALVGQRSG